MQDYTRVDFIARARALHPEVFRHGDNPVLHEEKILNEPDYLSEKIVVRLDGAGVDLVLDAEDKAMFEAFLHSAKCIADTTTIKTHDHLRLNGFHIRTLQSEAKIQTSDSVICAQRNRDFDGRS
jgi:hypothetical protein